MRPDARERFVVVARKGAIARDHVERTGAAVKTLAPGAEVFALREAVSSEGLARVFAAGAGWVSARCLAPAADADGRYAAALEADRRQRRERHMADLSRNSREILKTLDLGQLLRMVATENNGLRAGAEGVTLS